MHTKTPETLAADLKSIAPNFFGEIYLTLELFMRKNRTPFDVFSVKQAYDGTLVELYNGDNTETVFLVQRSSAAEVQAANVNSLERVTAQRNALEEQAYALHPLISAQYPGKYKRRMFDKPEDAKPMMGAFYAVKKVWGEYGHTLVLVEDIRTHLRDSQIIVLKGEWLEAEVKQILKSERLRL